MFIGGRFFELLNSHETLLDLDSNTKSSISRPSQSHNFSFLEDDVDWRRSLELLGLHGGDGFVFSGGDVSGCSVGLYWLSGKG